MTNAPIIHEPDFLTTQYATAAFERLWNELDWRRVTRRREYWTNIHDRPYSYGKPEYARVYESQPNHPVIDEIKELLLHEFGCYYEGCFLNGYESGRDALEWHADDDPGINHTKPIAIITLYDGPVMPANYTKMVKHPMARYPKGRSIQFMPQGGTKADVQTIDMAHGSLILMQPGMQSTHFHRIPKSGDAKPRPRISLTFRGLLA